MQSNIFEKKNLKPGEIEKQNACQKAFDEDYASKR